MRSRATYRRFRKQWRLSMSFAFALAVLIGGWVDPDSVNPNTAAALDTGASNDDLQAIVDEGRRQLDAQSARLDRVNGRAQALLTAGLAVLAFAAGGFRRLERVHRATLVTGWCMWLVAMGLIILGTVLAAAVIVVRADFDAIDTTQMSHWKPPLLPTLAEDYAKAVILGETTVAARVTVFRQATRLVSWSAIITAILWVVTQ